MLLMPRHQRMYWCLSSRIRLVLLFMVFAFWKRATLGASLFGEVVLLDRAELWLDTFSGGDGVG